WVPLYPYQKDRKLHYLIIVLYPIQKNQPALSTPTATRRSEVYAYRLQKLYRRGGVSHLDGTIRSGSLRDQRSDDGEFHSGVTWGCAASTWAEVCGGSWGIFCSHSFQFQCRCRSE